MVYLSAQRRWASWKLLSSGIHPFQCCWVLCLEDQYTNFESVFSDAWKDLKGNSLPYFFFLKNYFTFYSLIDLKNLLRKTELFIFFFQRTPTCFPQRPMPLPTSSAAVSWIAVPSCWAWEWSPIVRVFPSRAQCVRAGMLRSIAWARESCVCSKEAEWGLLSQPGSSWVRDSNLIQVLSGQVHTRKTTTSL